LGHTLIVEDDADSARMLAALVAREGHSVATAPTLADARRLMAMRSPDLLLLDLHLPDGNGFALFADKDLLSDTEVVLITGQATVETSVEALRLGAADYLVKPVQPGHLQNLLSRLVRPSELQAQLSALTETSRNTGRFCGLIGTSEPMQQVYQQIARVAGTAVTVFIQGESGTGKELAARAIHDLSRRREQPFLAVNCGAISPQLMESEIFGHERGSFTGAERQHRGFFEQAHGGTLFLDEVTEMPPSLQVKLLRVLESGVFMRVGSAQVLQTDVRVIAATNRNAEEAVARGDLREDLLYRLNVFPLLLPPLRERRGDIPFLAQSFLDELAEQEAPHTKYFTAGAKERLAAYDWPGNVRELRNVVQRAWVMTSGDEIGEAWLLSPTRPASGAAPPAPLADAAAPQLSIRIGTSLADAERELILATLAHCGGHKERTAAMLGISLKTLYNRLKEYQV
jgi:DNA-binding NtrC family response regulator